MNSFKSDLAHNLEDMLTRPAVGHPAFTSAEFLSPEDLLTMRQKAAASSVLADLPIQEALFTTDDFDRACVTPSRPAIPNMADRPSPVTGYGETVQ